MSAGSPTRLKFRLDGNQSGVWGGDPVDGCDDVVLRSTEVTVDGRWRVDAPAQRCLSTQDRRIGPLQPGDLVVTTSSGSAKHIGKTALVSEDVARLRPFHSNFMQRLRVSAGMSSRYAFYLINSHFGRESLRFQSLNSMAIRNLNGTMLGEVPVPVVDFDEQRRIADFLDTETARIDALIEAKSTLRNLVEERRVAAVTEAICGRTGGWADGEPSQHPLLGTVPSTWRIGRLKDLLAAPLAYGVLKPDRYEGSGAVRLVRITDIDSRAVDHSALITISPHQDREFRRTSLREGDLVVSVVGTIGRSFVVGPEEQGLNLSRALARVQLRVDIPVSFVQYWVESAVVADQIGRSQLGSAQQVLNLGAFREFLIPMPPWDDARRIVAFLDYRMGLFGEASDVLGGQIDLLTEYRQALITAAVTGQLDEATLNGSRPVDDDIRVEVSG